jgi:hypothetical protein
MPHGDGAAQEVDVLQLPSRRLAESCPANAHTAMNGRNHVGATLSDRATRQARTAQLLPSVLGSAAAGAHQVLSRRELDRRPTVVAAAGFFSTEDAVEFFGAERVRVRPANRADEGA